MRKMIKTAIAQINSGVGDLSGNAEKVVSFIRKAKKQGADLVVFPEMAITGYPPKDLLFDREFVRENERQLQKIAAEMPDVYAVVGYARQEEDKLYNAAALLHNKKIVGVYKKHCLPNYDVFDEKRYFIEGAEEPVFTIKDTRVGITICEDAWLEETPIKKLKENGATLIINISASPFHGGKLELRKKMVGGQAKKYDVPIIYVNLVGGQDDIVFDGGSIVFDEHGDVALMAKRFEEDFVVYPSEEKTQTEAWPLEDEVYNALILGLRDYVTKNNFKKAVIGLSGGIDSALTAALAAKAIGPENVIGVLMPSQFSSRGSVEDAEKLAKNLGIRYHIIPIKPIFECYTQIFKTLFEGAPFGITEENIQARIRGNILMAISNRFGHLVLTTGNKSEVSVGYCTLYGDMAGGFAVISDVPKTLVYKLAHFINKKENCELIPEASLTKPPSAELKENQKDTDSLPPYEILDPILQKYTEENLSKDEIITNGFDALIVDKVIKLVRKSEYKRHQAPLGIKVTSKAFGSGRRYPITSRWGLG